MGFIFPTKLGLGSLECKQTSLLVFSYLANLSLWFHGNKIAAASLDIASAFKAERKERAIKQKPWAANSVIICQKTIDFL